jgi:hypothetical protein
MGCARRRTHGRALLVFPDVRLPDRQILLEPCREAPYANRTLVTDPAVLFGNPYRDVGGHPHPIITAPDTPFPCGGTFAAMDPSINAPHVHCDGDRTYLADFTVGYETPAPGKEELRLIASNWRVSGILNARSGPRLSTLSGCDNAFNGMANQRIEQASNGMNGPKTVHNFLHPAVFSQPSAGKFGTGARNSSNGPGFHKVDLALSRLVSLTAARTIELRPRGRSDGSPR